MFFINKLLWINNNLTVIYTFIIKYYRVKSYKITANDEPIKVELILFHINYHAIKQLFMITELVVVIMLSVTSYQ